eukprot:CAMPEP_0185026982 /NCGR_PEP_ID=MMETSP1103-20130426/11717_1 /TAXON_ID=36769 /ORGANISM="Paraphysomonas bandaiensis, Strain Caron Lab Isolate" /LENGTH=87 /DNA_ID=CAMNT_0027560775 /DNA_START=27 /DNA_END=287 /DNA_ORIENTATION=+
MTQEVNGKKYLTCTRVYDMHSFCISFRSQLNQIRRYGKMQDCQSLFDDWKLCLSAKLVNDPDKKAEILESMAVSKPPKIVNDVWEYK